MKQLEVSEFFRKIFHLLNMVIPLIHVYFIDNRMGMLIFLSLMLIICFFIEFLRINQKYFIGLSGAQLISLAMFSVGLWFIFNPIAQLDEHVADKN